jgi:hypothetical protein
VSSSVLTDWAVAVGVSLSGSIVNDTVAGPLAALASLALKLKPSEPW